MLAVDQQVSFTHFMRLIVRWKTENPAVTRSILRTVITGLPHGLRGRRLCIDATNERFFATDLRSEFASLIPVDLVISSETLVYEGEEMNFKTYLGNLFVNTIEDGYVALPSLEWIKTSIRQVTRDRGTFEAEVAEDGDHGDVFDGCKLAIHALTAQGGPAQANAARVGTLKMGGDFRPGLRNPLLRKHQHGHGRRIHSI